jgi:hypothetical protein
MVHKLQILMIVLLITCSLHKLQLLVIVLINSTQVTDMGDCVGNYLYTSVQVINNKITSICNLCTGN